MSVAADYEANGRKDAAMSVYEHVLAQQPENAQAKQRRDLLAQQGVAPTGRPAKSEPRNPLVPSEPQTLMASRKPGAAASPKADAATQIAERNAALVAELAKKKAGTKPVSQAAASQQATVAASTPATTAKPEASFASKTESSWAKSTSATASAPAAPASIAKTETPVAASEDSWSAASSSDWKTAGKTPATKAADLEQDEFRSADENTLVSAQSTSKELVAHAESELPEIRPGTPAVAAPAAMPSTEATLAEKASTEEKVASVDPWQTTDLSRHDSLPKAEVAADEAWGPTRLVTLCDGLPADLVPLVEQLESGDPIVRVEGLQALGERGSDARAATVAVHALLEDSEPVVAVYAAGTLREIAGDAWSSVHTLSGFLKHEDEQIVRLSAYLLGQMGPEAMDAAPTLAQLRDNGSTMTSLHAAEALTHIAPADRKSFEKLNAALISTNSEVRWFAAVSLGTVAGECEPDAAAALRKALHDAEPQVRAAACLSLGGLGKHASIAISDLEEAARSDSSEVQVAAETALACLRG
ncbi:HEAT repeat domain-containing protein [Planctomicrobium piriforme]|nr:HEAT repeat domain-containing protein [Planctomicrobium piriforme]